MAFGDLKILAAITVPCSVNAYGRVRRPPRPDFDIANCDVKVAVSSRVSWNMKSSGPITVTFDGFIGAKGRNPVQSGQVPIQDNSLTAGCYNQGRYVIGAYFMISFFISNLRLSDSGQKRLVSPRFDSAMTRGYHNL